MPDNPTPPILVTSALPYANGPIHLGHLLEVVQTDIWVRFQRLQGRSCLYVCADDAHGTPIMLKAEEMGIKPEELIESVSTQHQEDFAAFGISFSNYHSSHSRQNRDLVEYIYQRLRNGGHIIPQSILQAYDESKGLFLPDRYVKGRCPRCKAEDQYGDSCEVCGATYSPRDLVEPRSILTDTEPQWRESIHYFFRLDDFRATLLQWLEQSDHVQPEIKNKLDEWFQAGLADWDISRDAPYFGFEIPDAPGKFFYVWLDAPIGYLASLKALSEKHPDVDFDTFWNPDSRAEVYHFIGKDIAYFHTLFWPAMLQGSGFRLPSGVFAHGFLTINGEKMSKSKGTFVTALKYRQTLDPEYLRYYFAARLGDGIDDIDLNLEDFTRRVNSDLVGKFVNIASRCAGFLQQHFNGRLSLHLHDQDLYDTFTSTAPLIAQYYRTRRYAIAMREIMQLADLANQYINDQKPWALLKSQGVTEEVQAICSQGIYMFRVLCIYLQPVLPRLTQRAREFLGDPDWQWNDVERPRLGSSIMPYEPLLQRIEAKQIAELVAPDPLPERPILPESAHVDDDTIDYDAFARVDLRVGIVMHAEAIPEAKKLLKLSVDTGDKVRTIFAGIKLAYQPEDIIGRRVVVVANLAPRKMRFGLSDGMILAAGEGGSDVRLIPAPDDVPLGSRVK